MSLRIMAAALAAATAIVVGSLSFATTAQAARDGGGGTSRSCLTGAARALLNRIEAKFGSMSIISTCRPGATIAGSGKESKHASGNAIDFEAGGRKGEVVRWLVANHHSGGTMTYGDMSHIHVDIGPHFVSLASGTRYASNDSGSSRSERRSSSRQRASRNDDGDDTPSPRSSRRGEQFAGYMGLGGRNSLDSK